jgi:hypothetical protein
MTNGIKINNEGAEALVLCAVIAIIGFILACANNRATVQESPGWYGITQGWSNWNSDINGEVGHRLDVDGPRGKCLPSRNWSGNAEIVSGTLPPGLSFGEGSHIVGIPTERGHWVVKARMSNIQCDGKYYKDFEQELRFHISGTGKVH